MIRQSRGINLNRQDVSQSVFGLRQLRQGKRLFVWGLMTGLAALLLCFITGLFSYRLSRQAHLESIARYNEVLSRQLTLNLPPVDAANSVSENTERILDRWKQWPRTDSGIYVCVIAENGKLAAHSTFPKKVGTDVSAVKIPMASGSSDLTVGELLSSKRDWAGENVNLRGKKQVAAYCYSDRLAGLVVVHTPAASYESDIRSAALPWTIGFGVATVGLWPACLILTQLAFRRFYNEALRSHKRLNDQYLELDRIYKTTPVGLCLLDTDLRFVRINEMMASINGHPVDSHIGRTLTELLPESDKSFEAVYQRVIETGHAELNHEFTRKNPHESNECSYYRASYHPVNSEGGQVIGLVAVVQDLTIEKRSEYELSQHALRLAHVSRLSTMGQMVAGIAHELNQPLAAIANYAAACSNRLSQITTNPPMPIHDWLKSIEEESLRCGDIISQLRGFVRRGDDSQSMVAVSKVIDESISLAAADRRYPRVTMTKDLGNTSTSLRMNRIQLQQVIVNLLRNACEAASDNQTDTPSVIVEASVLNGFVQVSIADNGPGIDEEQKESLFDPFFTTKEEGMGMGLAICKSIVESNGGKLWLEPKQHIGARFCFQLPLNAVAANE